MTKQKIFITSSFAQTQKIGEDMAKELKGRSGPQVICLHGNLGSGKTTFTQGFARGFEITNKIISPTFIIMRSYQIKGRTQLSYLYHVDLYRTHTARDVVEIGLLEIMKDPENIVLIEWAEKIQELLPEKKRDIYFEYYEEEKRKILIV
jgi:tRNA threonylcarbamoyladenosine biosynthesis protein TsaE